MKTSFCFYLKTLMPVHVGCDEVYEPSGFVMNEDSSEIVVFDPFDMIAQMEEKDRRHFSDICLKGTVASILEIYKFMRGRIKAGRKVPVCRGLVSHYLETLALPVGNERRIRQELNNFVINRTAFLPGDDRSYIPGSSIKGALRTAYLNMIADKENTAASVQAPRNSTELERRLLNGGKFETDPFRMLKVSDFMPVGDVNTRIVYAVNVKKRPSKFAARGPYQILEVIEPGSVFHGWIKVELPQESSGIRSPMSLDSLLGSLRFYEREKMREDDELDDAGVGVAKEAEDGGGWLLRLGRHSGAESVTIEGYRNIRVMRGQGEKAGQLNHATTFWLASEDRKQEDKKALVPFGWSTLNASSAEQESEFVEKEGRWKHAQCERVGKLREEIDRRLREAQEEEDRRRLEAQRREREEQLRREEEERRRAEIDAMPPEKQQIFRLQNGELEENQVVDLFNKLDTFQEKEALAEALKAHWKKLGKWDKKDCSKKQLTKVSKVKEVLGEE